MLVVRIIGGLGNQMLQYAFGKFLEKEGCDVRYDISDFSNYRLSSYKLKDFFDLDLPLVNEADLSRIKDNSTFLLPRIKRKLIGRNRYHIMQKDFNLSILDKNTIYYLDGYWHSLRYHKKIQEEIKSEFLVKKGLSPKSEAILAQIKETNSISVHFRRGDYVKNKKNIRRFNECDFNYYYPAANYIIEKIDRPTFFVFSDDIQWAKDHFRGFESIFVENSHDYEDLTLMYKCKHNIIANSTFSWWGAYLNSNKSKIVIAPKKWFLDEHRNRNIEFIPNNWQTL